jgi:hypothetical protein
MTRSAYKEAEAAEANMFVNVIQNKEESKSQGQGKYQLKKEDQVALIKNDLERYDDRVTNTVLTSIATVFITCLSLFISHVIFTVTDKNSEHYTFTYEAYALIYGVIMSRVFAMYVYPIN